MDRVAVFVDAGYLFAQGSIALTGQKLPRGSIAVAYESVLDTLKGFAESATDLPLLRIYWYDGTSTGPTAQHSALAFQPNVKVRLGFVNSVGEQKGVDSLIVTDMINLARNRAMAAAVLLSGDEDLRVGVQQAQELGVRVHLLGIRPSRGSQSVFLLQEADSTHEWGPDDLAPFLSCRQPAPPPTELSNMVTEAATVPRNAEADPLTHAAMSVARTIPESELGPLVATIRAPGQIPKAIDGQLLANGSSALEVPTLDRQEKKAVRAAFLKACEIRLAELPQKDH
ncbi:MAG: NYN domain-containing protein [Thermoanaerobaculia bacterium]|nr:NYN domain-containing protein [Thermoanaerobaculia bacterium]